MSLDWADYSSYEDELVYSRYFNLEEEMQRAERDKFLVLDQHKMASPAVSKKASSSDEMKTHDALLTQIRAEAEGDMSLVIDQHERVSPGLSKKASSSDKMTGLQKTDAPKTERSVEAERDMSLVCDQRERVSPGHLKKASSSDEITGLQKTKALQTQMKLNVAIPNQFQHKEKSVQEEFNNFSNSEYGLRNDLLNESQQREKLLLEEIARLNEEVATEANLRQKADDERGMMLVNLKLEMFFQAAAAKTREEAVQKQFDDLKEQREAERDNFTKSQTGLKERFEEEKKTMEEEICHLKEEVANEAKLRQRAEDNRGVILVQLKLELASQASVAKAREDALLKDMEDLKSCQDFQSKLFNKQLHQLLQEHGTMKSDLQGEIATLKEVHTNEINQQSGKMKALQEEMEETKEALKNSEKERASFTKETFELKKQIMDKIAEIEALKNEVYQRTDSLEKVTVAAGQKSQEWDLEKQTLLKDTERLRNKLQRDKAESKLEKQTLLKQIDEFKGTLQRNEAESKLEKQTLLKQIYEFKSTLQKNEAECKSEKQTLLKQIDQLKGMLQKNEAESMLEKQILLKQMDELKSALQKNEADNQALRETSAKLEAELDNVKNETIMLGCHLNKEAEQKARMAEQIQRLKKQIKEMKEEAVQTSTCWEVEKTSLLKNLVNKFREKESEKQTLMKKIKQVEQEAVQQKASHKQAMSELQEEKACMMKETQDLKMALKRNGDVTERLQEMVRALDQELEKKPRVWFKRLFYH